MKGHPWKEMLAGRQPKVTKMSRYVPHDQYLVEFRSLTTMLGVLDRANLTGMHFLQQAKQAAHSPNLKARTMKQLAIRSSGLSRPFYDLVVGGVGVTGSDLFEHAFEEDCLDLG